MALRLLLFAALAVAVPTTELPSRATTNDTVFVTSVSQCPTLPRRSSRPTSVHDLRPDDFSVVMAIGDSITAGALAKGLQGDLISTLSEWRGVSYAAGGDPGALTIPNLIKHYRPSVFGASKGSHGIELCFGILCPIGPFGWNSDIDVFNAAQTGALASNLLHEVRDYLVPQVKAAGIPSSAYKYLSFQIGSNDICQMCLKALTPTGADDFEADVRAALEYVRKNIPNVLVNVIGVLPVSQIYSLTLNQSYCQKAIPILPHLNIECTCILVGGAVGNATRTLMDSLMNQYNNRLQKIVRDYQRANYPTFAATWQPASVPLATYPIEALSDTDCFHPSQKAHAGIAASVWNRLTLGTSGRAESFAWSDAPPIRCLQTDDRIPTKSLL